MPLVLFAAASFACLNPTHHDGDAIRCDGMGKAMRLHGIDAPEMPDACRPGRACTPGDPYAARDHLESLTRGHNVTCEQVDTDHYGRRVVECRADGRNIACAMIADGYAVERYGSPDCGNGGTSYASEAATDWPGGEPPRPGRVDTPAGAPTAPRTAFDPPAIADAQVATAAASPPAWPVPPLTIALGWLVLANLTGFGAMAADKRRAVASTYRRVQRVPESTLLFIAAIGGSLGTIAAQRLLRHKTLKQPFASKLLWIAGLQIGAVLGLVLVNAW